MKYFAGRWCNEKGRRGVKDVSGKLDAKVFCWQLEKDNVTSKSSRLMFKLFWAKILLSAFLGCLKSGDQPSRGKNLLWLDFADETRQGDGEFYRPSRFLHIVYFLFLNLFISLYCLARFKSAVVLAIVTPSLSGLQEAWQLCWSWCNKCQRQFACFCFCTTCQRGRKKKEGRVTKLYSRQKCQPVEWCCFYCIIGRGEKWKCDIDQVNHTFQQDKWHPAKP